MKHLFPLFVLGLGLLLTASCSRPSATISGCVENGEKAKITLLHHGATTRFLLDTLRTDARGCFSYKLKQTGNAFEPMFVSVAIDDEPLASLLVAEQENIRITAVKGQYNYTVEGSEGSTLLQLLNSDLYAASQRFDSLARMAEEEQKRTGRSDMPASLARGLSDVYLKQYRDVVRFIVRHPASLVCVAALKERLPNGLPLFSRNEDAIYFKMVHDSLKTRYPKSEYVQALRDEYEQRYNEMRIVSHIEQATETGFIDLSLPDATAQQVALSSLKGKAILLYFWMSSDREQQSFNYDLKALYKQYHLKDFDIYQVSLDEDKALWAKTVTDQELPWINVCAGLGDNARVIAAYNITRVPVAFFINRKGDITGSLAAENLQKEALAKKIDALCR
jgi:peroxiredoxin